MLSLDLTVFSQSSEVWILTDVSVTYLITPKYALEATHTTLRPLTLISYVMVIINIEYVF